MAKHEVKCLRFADTGRLTNARFPMQDATTGLIEVKPPIVVGEGFKDSVLGQDQNGMDLKHILTTTDATYIAVEASLYDSKTHEEMIGRARGRIALLATAPDEALTLAVENPFPAPGHAQFGA